MNYHFIINPRSGNAKNIDAYEAIIGATCGRHGADYTIKHTKNQGHERVLAKEAVQQKAHVVVAVGGDGTINHIASELVGTETRLGIIPKGSGNGLANELGIPRNPAKACAALFASRPMSIDVGKMNDQYFFNIA
ncbi:MAG: acylglycerol kinase family protein, partial [Elusimicrobiota bacterium]